MNKGTNQDRLKSAVGKIDYTLMNDYIFHRVMQDNEISLKGIIGALLHLKPEQIASVTILNPIQPGDYIDSKTCILDVKVLLNNKIIINIELQVKKQYFWDDRSVVYAARIIGELKKDAPYTDMKFVYHIGILNFTLFPEHPEFFATNQITNVKKHYIYNDKLTLNVLDLTQIELATDEDKKWKLDDWARLFKAETWEELYMLAQKDDVLNETCETIFKLNQEDVARYWAEAREEGLRVAQSTEKMFKNAIAERDKTIAEKDAEIARLRALLGQK